VFFFRLHSAIRTVKCYTNGMDIEKPQHSSPFIKWSLVFGIIIVLNLFFNYTLSLVYTAPDYNAFVPQSLANQDIKTKAACDAVQGQWDGSYCDASYLPEQNYEAAQKFYDENVFIALILFGVASLIGGALLENEVLSLAFSWAGVLSLFIASVRYWSDANNLFKVIILAIALAGLIWTAIKKFT
jgi:hypothetical protein